ncbi:hypothetical protein YN1HA_2440 [Sulfurisphaera ohwakuensis]
MIRIIMSKILIIYVDIDDDLGKIGLETPIIGEERVKKAIDIASETIPTDSDFNTMVVAYNIYKKLRKENNDVEIAFISGSERSNIEGQIEFSRKLDEAIKTTNAEEAIIVYDSPEDAKAIPIIQSKLKVIGIERVLVEQYRGVEETYALLGRYIKKAISDPRFARIFLGVPGIILITIGIFSLLNLTVYATPAILIIIGLALLGRGLRIDEYIEQWWENSTIMVIAAIISLISTIVGIIEGYYVGASIKLYDLSSIFIILTTILPFIVFAIIVLFGAKAINKVMNRDIKVWHDIFRIIAVIIIYYMMVLISKNLEENVIGVQLQTMYTLSVITLVLVSLYIVFSIIEKHIT